MLVSRIARLLLATFVASLTLAGSAGADASDPNSPQIELDSPAEGWVFFQGQSAQAAYGCWAGALGWPVVACVGDLPLGALLDTSTVGTHSFSVRAEDYLGARTTVTHSYTVVDVIGPRITMSAPEDRAVYPFGAAVNVSYACDDPGGSGVQACLGSLQNGSALPTDHIGTFSVDVTAFDWAGNSSTLHRTYQVVDTTPPAITVAQPAPPFGDHVPVYTVNQVVYADYSCSDGGGSGVLSCLGSVPAGSPLDTSSPGRHVFTVFAKDAAHNFASVARSYDVVYVFDGFAPPLAPAPSLASFKAGDVVPVKFSLHGDFGLGAVTGVTSQAIPCGTETTADSAAPASGTLGYAAGPDRYTFAWATDRGWLGTCRQLTVALADGSLHRAGVRFVK
jgi:hypothetical protein